MPTTASQKKALDQYYKELAAYHEKNVTHETAVRSAFQNLLATFAQAANWVLIPEQTLANGKRPDGTLRDSFNLPRGYWEAKDSLRVNEWLTLADIPQACYQYRLGNCSALEWVIDQYQVITDARSGIPSDPNSDDNE